MNVAVEKLNEAADHIMTLASRYEGMVNVSRLLREIGSIEQHVSELSTKRDELLSAIEGLKRDQEELATLKHTEIAALEEKIVATTEQGVRLENAANEKIQAMFLKAEFEASEAARVVYESKSGEIQTLEKQIAEARANLEQLQADITTFETDKIRIAAETVAAQAGLAEVLRTIEQLSKFGSIPGGNNNGTE